MNKNQIIAILFANQDLAYQKFNSSLLPGIDNLIGVRMPILRKIAKEILKHDFKAYLDTALSASDTYYEEALLQAIVLAHARLTLDERLSYIQVFLPKINNWAVCDCFCSNLKEAKLYPAAYWKLVLKSLYSTEPFTIRFGIVLILNYFLSTSYIDKALKQLVQIQSQSYYVNMALAWALSIMYINKPKLIIDLLQNKQLPPWIHNKTIQKICESLRVTPKEKQYLKALRQ